MNEEPNKKIAYRLGWGAIVILIQAAVFGDLLSFIPILGSAVGPIFWVLVAWYLYTKGFGLLNPGRLATELVSMAAEMIPAIQWLPTLLLGTILIIILSRLEDKLGVQIPMPGRSLNMKGPLNQGGARLPVQPPAPLNTGGVRAPQKPQNDEENPPDA